MLGVGAFTPRRRGQPRHDDAKLDAIRTRGASPSSARRGATAEAVVDRRHQRTTGAAKSGRRRRRRASMVAEIKEQLQTEMGLLPVHLLRDRPIELRRALLLRQPGQDELRHGRIPGRRLLHHRQARGRARCNDEDDRQSARKIHVGEGGLPRQGNPGEGGRHAATPTSEVHSGDWAIIKTRDLDLPALHVDTAFAYDFADPIFRLGNDYSKGIILSTGYVGQRDRERPRHLPDRRPPGRVGRRRPRPARQPGRHPDRPDAGRLPLLVHPADSRRDAAQAAGLRAARAGRHAAVVDRTENQH